MMFDARFAHHLRMLLVIIMLLNDQGKGMDNGSSDQSNAMQKGVQADRKRLKQQMPTIIDVLKNEPSNVRRISLFNKAFYFSEVSNLDAQVQTFDRVRMGASKGRKLGTEQRYTVDNKRHGETTMFEPGQKGVDAAASVAFSADYWPPRHHPPKNN